MSTAETEIKKKSKPHQKYFFHDGTEVNGATTILGIISKHALPAWANKLGLEGVALHTYMDKVQRIGTLAHSMIFNHLNHEAPEPLLDEYPKDEADIAQNCFLSYLEWEKAHVVEAWNLEFPLVSTTYRYGGTADFYGLVDGELTIMDFKTGKDIYDEYFYQLAAYANLVSENLNQGPIKRYVILNIQKSDKGVYREEVRNSLEREWGIFKLALDLYLAVKQK